MPDQNQPPAVSGSVQVQPLTPEEFVAGAPDDHREPEALFDAESLFEIVETYASFGNHLTGTDADRDTTDWLAEVLERLGATVELHSFEFERYVCNALLHAGAESVPCAPVFYSGYGRWETTNIQVVELDKGSVAGQPTSLSPLIKGPAGNRAIALALNGPDDLPVHCNRVPAVYGVATGPGQPAVVIPRNWADRVRDGAELSFDGELEPSSSRNIVATFGSPDARRVTVTTPLTGWTPCAGERGTGIAAALALAADLAGDHYVVFVGGSGHELDHLGIRNYLSTNNVANQPVVHVGASVGAVERLPDGTAVLGSERRVLCTASESLRAGIAERTAAANFAPASPAEWPGEGGTWKEAGAAVLSFVGGSEHFHVSTDLAEVATTGPALELATRAVIDASRHFLSGGAE